MNKVIFWLDMLIPRFITEYVAIDKKGKFACSARLIEPGTEDKYYIAKVSSFNFFGRGYFGKVVA